MAEIVISAKAATLVWGLISVIFGVMVLAYPKILNYLVAFYLIISGILMMLPAL